MPFLNENDILYKGLTVLAIEKTLLDIGKPIYDEVIYILDKKYHCYLSDCYEHPQYLNEILKELYGKAYGVVVEKINKQLEEFSYKTNIGRFIEVISR